MISRYPAGGRPRIGPAAALGVTLLAALSAGSIDLVYASSFVQAGVTMTNVMQAIASGLLGPAAFRGGAGAAILGAALHYAIIWMACGLFLAAARTFPIVLRRRVLAGLVLGAGLCVVMNFAVVPLSRAPFGIPADPVNVLKLLAVHMIGIGLPIALIIAPTLARSTPDTMRVS